MFVDRCPFRTAKVTDVLKPFRENAPARCEDSLRDWCLEIEKVMLISFPTNESAFPG